MHKKIVKDICKFIKMINGNLVGKKIHGRYVIDVVDMIVCNFWWPANMIQSGRVVCRMRGYT